MKTIAILGGMGPQATIDLYQKITQLSPAEKDQDHLHIIIDSNAKIPDRSAHLLQQGPSPLPELLKSAKLLEKSGADAIIIACNTAHAFLEPIKAQIKIPILSIVDACLEALKTKNAKRLLLLATKGTYHAKIYQKLNTHYTLLEPTDDDKNTLMQLIYDGAKKGQIKTNAKPLEALIKHYNADISLLSCTELPLFLPYFQEKQNILDASAALAQYAINFAYGACENNK